MCKVAKCERKALNQNHKKRGDVCKVAKYEKNAPIFFCWFWKKTEFILIDIWSPIFVQNLVTLAWKMNPGMPKEAGSLNGPLCAYLIRQNLHNRTHPRAQGSECPCHVSKWSVKIYGRESANGDFPCAKLPNAKKIANFFLPIMKKAGIYID